MEQTNQEVTLNQAKAFLSANQDKGATCPCCNQFVKVYKRKLNSGMALFLTGLYKLSKENPRPYTNEEVFRRMNISVKSLDYSVLRHWGLIQECGDSQSNRKSGFWKITQTGEAFIERRISIPTTVSILNNTLVGYSNEPLTIDKISKFNYQELLGS